MDERMTRVGWWVLAVVCAVYGSYALATGYAELLFVLGAGPETKHRATPLVFVIHSLTGAVALLAGPLQFNPRIRKHLSLHRAIGRSYVIAVWVASAFALLDARSFAVSTAARIVFALISAAWFATTMIGYWRVRARRFAEHREWMVRSVSLSLFFVTFSLWVPGLAGTTLPPALAYPLALVLSGGLNLGAAELWIRRTRASLGRLDDLDGDIAVELREVEPDIPRAGGALHRGERCVGCEG